MWVWIPVITFLVIILIAIVLPAIAQSLKERRMRIESGDAYILYKRQEQLAKDWWTKELNQLRKSIENPNHIINQLYYQSPFDVERIKILRKYLKSEGFKVKLEYSHSGKDEYTITWK